MDIRYKMHFFDESWDYRMYNVDSDQGMVVSAKITENVNDFSFI